MVNPRDIEILPPDPEWEPPRPHPARTFDAIPVRGDGPRQTRRDKESERQAREASEPVRPATGDPRILARLLKIGAVVMVSLGVLGFLVWALQPFGADFLPNLVALLREQAPWSKLMIVLGIAALVPIFIPVGPVAAIPGLLWGTAEGTALTLAGAALGGMVNFALSRRMLAGHVRAWLAANPLLQSLQNTVDARGFRIVLGLRMSPVMPFGLLSYLSGLTKLTLPQFLTAVIVGGIPWTAVYAMAGSMLAGSNSAVSLTNVADSPEARFMRWFGLGVTLLLAVWIGRLARKELLQNKPEGVV